MIMSAKYMFPAIEAEGSVRLVFKPKKQKNGVNVGLLLHNTINGQSPVMNPWW